MTSFFKIAFVAILAIPGLGFVTTTLLLLQITPAAAVPIQPAAYLNYVKIGATVITSPEPGDYHLSVGASRADTFNLYAIPSVGVIVDNPDILIVGEAESFLDYYMRIDGSTEFVNVGVQSIGRAATSGPGGFGSASLLIQGPSVNIQQIACSDCIFGTGQFSFNSQVPFATGQIYQIQMLAGVFGIVGTGSAFLDPFFSVPEGYSLELSEGIGNLAPTPVPEPSTLGLIGLGLLGLGAMRRRRRKNAHLAEY